MVVCDWSSDVCSSDLDCSPTDRRFRPVSSPNSQTRTPEFPQCHRTLPFFRRALSAGLLPDPAPPTASQTSAMPSDHVFDGRIRPVCSLKPLPRPDYPNFRNAIGHFSDRRSRLVPKDPPAKRPQCHQTLLFFRRALSASRLPHPSPPPPDLRIFWCLGVTPTGFTYIYRRYFYLALLLQALLLQAILLQAILPIFS